MSGPGEGAYATVVTDRSVGNVIITDGGSGYSLETKVIAFDATGFPVYDVGGAIVDQSYGNAYHCPWSPVSKTPLRDNEPGSGRR